MSYNIFLNKNIHIYIYTIIFDDNFLVIKSNRMQFMLI